MPKKLKSLEQFDKDVKRGDLVKFQLAHNIKCVGYYLGRNNQFQTRGLSMTFPNTGSLDSWAFDLEQVMGKKILGYEVLRRYQP